MDAPERRRGVIKRDQVQLAGPGGPPRSQPAPGVPAAPAAGVRLVRLGEDLQALEFTCSCGEVSLIEITCEKKP
jgi:hypothetical protein